MPRYTSACLFCSQNLTESEEAELIRDLRLILPVLGSPLRLRPLREELRDYDPYDNGFVDASTLQRVCMKYLKQVIVHGMDVVQTLQEVMSSNREVSDPSGVHNVATNLPSLR